MCRDSARRLVGCRQNMSLTPFDLIADPNPWGSSGDLRLLPDDKAHFRFAIDGSATPLDIVMSDIVELDGTPWVCCPRSFLKQATVDLEREAGLTMLASFEHEFQMLDVAWPARTRIRAAGAASCRPLRASAHGGAARCRRGTGDIHPRIWQGPVRDHSSTRRCTDRGGSRSGVTGNGARAVAQSRLALFLRAKDSGRRCRQWRPHSFFLLRC